MGTISSGIGLISGIDTHGLIQQLLQIEARPRIHVEQRVIGLERQKAALLDINSQLLSLRNAAEEIGDEDLFTTRKAASSNESVLTATAGNDAAEGTHHLTVSRLVSTHQLITQGVAGRDALLGEGTLRFNSHHARLDGDVELADLNGQAGVERGEIQITDRSGASAVIDLTRAVTLGDVVDAINDASAIDVTATLDGDGLRLTDASGSVVGDLTVEDLGSTSTAADLGIAGASGGTDTIAGGRINILAAGTRLDRINDGTGVRTALGKDDLRIDLGGAGFDVNLDDATTIGGVIDAINNHAGNTGVTASIADDGVSMRLDGAGTITVSALNGSKAAGDLGLAGSAADTLDGDRLLASLGSKLLKNLHGGGGALDGGTIEITNRAGGVTQVDLSAARSVSDILAAINDANAGVTASLNGAGNGVQLTDATGSTGTLSVSDVSGNTAAYLNLDQSSDADPIDSDDLNLRYLSENTRLDTLNGGDGVAKGKFTLTDSNGVTATVDLTQDTDTTLDNVIREINSRATSITASINETGDGILLTDTAGGAMQMKVEEAGSTTARDLGILGEAAEGTAVIDGSFEKTIEVTATDTLGDIADKINQAGIFIQASILNDGSSSTPYRLNLTSTRSGADGRVLFDDGGLGLGAETLTDGEDAMVLFGSSDPARALLLTSSTNTLTDTLQDVEIDLHAASDEPVQLTVSRDDDTAVEAIAGFVESFNAAIDSIDEHDSYNIESEERGVLLGDPTVGRVRRRLFSIVNATVEGVSGQYDHLSQVGLTVGGGARLQFDEEKFRAALADDPAAVQNLFTATTTTTRGSDYDLPEGVTLPESDEKVLEPIGFGQRLEELIRGMTDTIDGTMTRRTETLDGQVEQANRRIEHLNGLLESKRQRLEFEFAAMESALAQLQTQQSALAGLSNLASQMGGGFGN